MSAATTTEASLDAGSDRHPHGGDCRCPCGNLLARVVGDRVELKCRRCKRTHLIPIRAGRPPSAAPRRVAPRREADAR